MTCARADAMQRATRRSKCSVIIPFRQCCVYQHGWLRLCFSRALASCRKPHRVQSCRRHVWRVIAVPTVHSSQPSLGKKYARARHERTGASRTPTRCLASVLQGVQAGRAGANAGARRAQAGLAAPFPPAAFPAPAAYMTPLMAQQNEQLRQFWHQQMQEILGVGTDPAEFKNHQLPLARIKKARHFGWPLNPLGCRAWSARSRPGAAQHSPTACGRARRS